MLELKEEKKKIKNGRQPYGLLQQSTSTLEACESGPIFVFLYIYIYKRWNIVQTRDLSASHRCVSTNSHKAKTLFNNYNLIIKPKISYQHFYKIDLSLDVVYVTIVVAGMMLKGYDKIMIK
jgi:hypothetical protein